LSGEKLQSGKDTKPSQPASEETSEQPPASNFNGAAIIDSKGQEVPITESMIVEAFDRIGNSDKPQ